MASEEVCIGGRLDEFVVGAKHTVVTVSVSNLFTDARFSSPGASKGTSPKAAEMWLASHGRGRREFGPFRKCESRSRLRDGDRVRDADTACLTGVGRG